MRLLVLALKRVAWMPPTLLGLTLIVFAVSHVIPADPGIRVRDLRGGRRARAEPLQSSASISVGLTLRAAP